MNERIKELRTALKLTQDEFAKRIGLNRSSIANYETGRKIPSDSIILSICREYNVNEQWLRHDTGDMFIEVPTNELDALAKRYNLPPTAKKLVQAFVELEAKQMLNVLDFMATVFTDTEEIAVSSQPKVDHFKQERDNAIRIIEAQANVDTLYNADIKKEKLS